MADLDNPNDKASALQFCMAGTPITILPFSNDITATRIVSQLAWCIPWLEVDATVTIVPAVRLMWMPTFRPRRR